MKKKIKIDLKRKTFLYQGSFYGYVEGGLVYIFTDSNSYISPISSFKIRSSRSSICTQDTINVYPFDFWKEISTSDLTKKNCFVMIYPNYPIDIILPDINSVDNFFKLIRS